MISPARRRVRLPLVALVLALGIWIFPVHRQWPNTAGTEVAATPAAGAT